MPSGAGYRQMKSTVIMDSTKERATTGFGPDDSQLIKQLAMGSTVRIVSNCEDVTDWDISDSANFNAVNETTIIRTGSNALEITDDGTTTGTFITLDDAHKPDSEDWTDFNFLGMWVEDGTALRLAGEMTFQISNAGTWATAIAVPVCVTVDVPQYVWVDITGVARGSVDGFRFVNERGTGSSEKVYIDSIYVTDLIAGLGTNLSAGVGPFNGSCAVHSVNTGETILPGDFVQYEKGGVSKAVADDTAIIGMALQSAPFVNVAGSDTVPTEVIVGLAPGIVAARYDGSGATLGDALLVASGNKTVGDATTSFIKICGIALETGEANAVNWIEIHKMSLHS